MIIISISGICSSQISTSFSKKFIILTPFLVFGRAFPFLNYYISRFFFVLESFFQFLWFWVSIVISSVEKVVIDAIEKVKEGGAGFGAFMGMFAKEGNQFDFEFPVAGGKRESEGPKQPGIVSFFAVNKKHVL